jgi:Ankyrin repeats (3 copies)
MDVGLVFRDAEEEAAFAAESQYLYKPGGVARFIEAHGTIDHVYDGGFTRFHLALKSHDSIAQWFISNGASVNQTNDHSSGCAPLHMTNSVQVAKTLIGKGANVNQGDFRGETPFVYAVRRCNPRLAQLLLDNGANIHAINYKGQNALHLAAKAGHASMVTWLLNRGLDVNATCTDKTRIALHYAVLYDHVEVVRVLLARGSRVNEVDDRVYKPLGYLGCLSQTKGCINMEMFNLLWMHGGQTYGCNSAHWWICMEVDRRALAVSLIFAAKQKLPIELISLVINCI